MEITKIADINGNKNSVFQDGAIHKTPEYHVDLGPDDVAEMRDGRLYVNGKEELSSGIRNADLLFFFCWHDLTDDQKRKIGSQVWEYGAASQKWHPLTALYTG